ncbi:MAG: transglutaminase domain-containing protein, partial [Ruminococcus sp.]|nr:transglutaminase domain-containing protein [Ruminococcus sp.]
MLKKIFAAALSLIIVCGFSCRAGAVSPWGGDETANESGTLWDDTDRDNAGRKTAAVLQSTAADNGSTEFYTEGLAPSYVDLGDGCVAVSFNPPAEKYSCKLNYRKGGVTYVVSPGASGYIYLSGLKAGKSYPATLVCSAGGEKTTESFDISLSKKTEEIVHYKFSTENSLTFQWEDFAPGQTYVVCRQTDGVFKAIALTKGTCFTDKDLESGKAYTYTVAVKGIKKILPIPAANSYFYTAGESVKEVTADFGEGTLKWDAVKEADGYRIYWESKNGYVQAKDIGDPAKLSVKISKENKFHYAVAPYNKNSDGSVTLGKLTPAGGKPAEIAEASDNTETADNANPSNPSNVSDGEDSESVQPNDITKMQQMTVFRSTVILGSASWGSSVTANAAKGNSIYVGAAAGNFYKCTYECKDGYIYKRAVTGGNALDRSQVTSGSLDAYLDDILYDTGTSVKSIWDFTNTLKYSMARTDGRITNVDSLVTYRRELAASMIKNRSGMCYHYAALAAELLNRAGYSTKLVYCPHTNGGFHCYNMVLINGNWTVFDATRHAENNA